MEQTAVEFLYDQVWKTPISKWHKLLEQAKQMEENQINNAYQKGRNDVENLLRSYRDNIDDIENLLK